MKYKHLLFCVLFSCIPSWGVKAEDCFKMSNSKNMVSSIPVDLRITGNNMFVSFSPGEINGLSVSGNVAANDSDFLVRIILKDVLGKEYLVLESYKEITEGHSFLFDDYCEETAFLQNVYPDSIKIFVKNAIVNLTNINIMRGNTRSELVQSKAYTVDSIRKRQARVKANRINAYNRAHDKLWRAGVTTLSLMNFSDRRRVLGIEDNSSTGGFEYYSEGIFEIGERDRSSNIEPDSTYIDCFDWRDRHGKNWITSIKDQGSVNFCSSFTVIGCVEALVNLYYNQIINMDLSEQEVACCSGISNPYNGTFHYEKYKLVKYVRDHGVCDEAAYPFVVGATSGYCRSEEIIPNELVKIADYVQVVLNEDSIKSALINHGPLVSGVYTSDWIKHAMPIVGYGQLHVGDTVFHWVDENGHANGSHLAMLGNPRIGQTYLIYKGSNGILEDDPRQGYMYIIHDDYSSSMSPTFYCTMPIETISLNDDDIVCEDADGDGYYFWGLGSKPENCPSWVPDEKDGDDSDINYGPMSEYGYLLPLPDGVTINTPTIYSQNNTIDFRIGIVKNGVLTINGTTTLSGNSRIRVCENGTLIVDGGTLQNANIEMVPGSSLIVRNGGIINIASGQDFDIPVGVQVNIEDGVINTEPLLN